MPNPYADVVEQVIRDLIADNPDLPIKADFFRGISAIPLNVWGDRILREEVTSPACGREWFVLAKPGATEVIVSAAGRSLFDVNDVIGEVTVVPLPQTTPGVVDVDALASSRFHVELLAAVREKAAVVAQMQANITA